MAETDQRKSQCALSLLWSNRAAPITGGCRGSDQQLRPYAPIGPSERESA
jgi:hypothetical protein